MNIEHSILTKMATILQQAESFAEKKHKGQKRLNGEEDINHPRRVARIVAHYKKSHKLNELIAAAFLHDTLEDTDTGINELRELFGETITLLVLELTTDEKSKELLGKTKYLSTKLADSKKVSNWALVIKLADRLDNLTDLVSADEQFKRKYILETKEIISHIETKRSLTKTHKKLIESIKEILRKYN